MEQGLPATGRRTFDPIVLCCFGRGGSSLAWNLIGSSSDVLMISQEWHTAAFHKAQIIPRVIRLLHRNGHARSQGLKVRLINRLIAPSAASSCHRAIEPAHLDAKPGAGGVAIKLMDYHLLHMRAIERGFGRARPVLMTREPLAQAESLLRSGLTLEEATRWCRDVLNLMDEVRRRWAAPVFRFEDLVADPAKFVRDLYGALNLTSPPDGLFRVKMKAYGESRYENVDPGGSYRHLNMEELRGFVDADVNVKAIARLSKEQRDFIQQGVGEVAGRFGYSLKPVPTRFGGDAQVSDAASPVTTFHGRSPSACLIRR